MGQNLNLELPKWAEKVNGTICVKSPLQMYQKEVGEDVNFSHLSLICCGGECGSIMHIYYHGLEDLLLSDHTYIQFVPEFSEQSKIEGYNSISVDSRDEKVFESSKRFYENVQKAIDYKLDLVKGFIYELQFSSNALNVNMIVREDGTVLLYKLNKELSHDVPIISNPKSKNDLLGVVHRFDESFDFGGIMTGDVPSNREIFEVLFIWVEKLFFLNREELHKGKLNLRVEKC
jgi:hypothetical protein